VYRQAHATIEVELARGALVIFDATNLEEEKRRRLYEIADGAGAGLHLIWLWAPVGVIARRLWQRATDRDPEDRSDGDWRVYRDLVKLAQAPTRPFLILNTTVSTEDQLSILEHRLMR
jgi:predicted kinase